MHIYNAADVETMLFNSVIVTDGAFVRHQAILKFPRISLCSVQSCAVLDRVHDARLLIYFILRLIFARVQQLDVNTLLKFLGNDEV